MANSGMIELNGVAGLPETADVAARPAVFSDPLAVQTHPAPDSGLRLGADLALFHDAARPDLSLTQEAGAGGPPWALVADIGVFDGRFFSLALDLAPAALAGLGDQHLVFVDTVLDLSRPVQVYARLNLRTDHGVVEMLRAVAGTGGPSRRVGFDIAHAGLKGRKPHAGWVDLIFEDPSKCCCRIDDIMLWRRSRAFF